MSEISPKMSYLHKLIFVQYLHTKTKRFIFPLILASDSEKAVFSAEKGISDEFKALSIAFTFTFKA